MWLEYRREIYLGKLPSFTGPNSGHVCMVSLPKRQFKVRSAQVVIICLYPGSQPPYKNCDSFWTMINPHEKNGETRKPTYKKNGGQGLPGYIYQNLSTKPHRLPVEAVAWRGVKLPPHVKLCQAGRFGDLRYTSWRSPPNDMINSYIIS